MALCDAAVNKGMADWKMTFNTRRFRKGLNVSFRNDIDKYIEMVPGDTIFIVDKFGKHIGNGRVLSTHVLDVSVWKHQADYLMKFDPDWTSRDLDGLKRMMNEVYGEKNWGPKLIAVLFWKD